MLLSHQSRTFNLIQGSVDCDSLSPNAKNLYQTDLLQSTYLKLTYCMMSDA